MHDGRAFTDYRPRCEVNNMMMRKYNTSNDHEYRMFLQKNGNKIQLEAMTQPSTGDCRECPVCKSV